MDELLQHLLTGDGESSSLGDGTLVLLVALDGLGVGVAKDGREKTGAEG